MAVLLASGSSVLCYGFYLYNDYSSIFLALSLLASPAMGGFVAGLVIRGRHFRLYCLLGLVMGAINFVGANLFGMLKLGMPLPFVLHVISASQLIIYMVGQPILFVLSGLMGDWIERRVFHQPLAQETTLRAATVLANLSSSSSGDRAREIEFWKGLLL